MRRTNFIPDVVNCDLPLDNRRSPGWRRVEPFMTGNTFYLWIGQHENGRYSKAHAHTSAAVLICLKGKGYTYTWPERYGVTPWKDGKRRRGQARRLRARSAWCRRRPAARAGTTSISARRRSRFRLTAWFGPHNPGREPGPPGEKHTDYTAMDIPEGGIGDPLLDGRSLICARNTPTKLKAEGVREPHGARVLQEGHRGAEIRRRVNKFCHSGAPRSARARNARCALQTVRGYGFRACALRPRPRMTIEIAEH